MVQVYGNINPHLSNCARPGGVSSLVLLCLVGEITCPAAPTPSTFPDVPANEVLTAPPEEAQPARGATGVHDDVLTASMAAYNMGGTPHLKKRVIDIMVPVDMTGATTCSLSHRYMMVTIDGVPAERTGAADSSLRHGCMVVASGMVVPAVLVIDTAISVGTSVVHSPLLAMDADPMIFPADGIDSTNVPICCCC